MKKNITLLIALLLITSYLCYSQVIDYTQLECVYSYTMVGDRLQPERKTTDEVILLVGNTYACYYSYMNYIADSLRKANPAEYGPQITVNNKTVVMTGNMTLADIASQGDALAIGMPRTTLPYNLFNKEYYLINKASGELECREAVMIALKSHYCYYMEIPEKPVWKLSRETAMIAGYRCQKASTRYGGRDWTAWFSPEIAVSEGPWKLRGLPGLILKAETADGEFALTCTSLKRSTGKPIVKDEQHQYRKISKKELFSLKKASWNTPDGPPFDYNFIEILNK